MILNEFSNFIDASYTEEIMDKLASFGDDPATGNRSAGSKASTEAANYLYEKFKEIGLKNITMDDYLINGWTFKGASLEYLDASGNSKKATLGGYATNFKADNEKYSLVYGGKGTINELNALGDITNKLVLISHLNPFTDCWVNYPAYQAYLKNAAGIIVAGVKDIEIDEMLLSNDTCGPSYCKALSISLGDSKTLQTLIKSNPNKEITVTLNADSTVLPYAKSYNIWGDIPGKSDEVIYLIAHYDGYYHSCFDDASGVSEIIGIAKAIINSGYENQKTIRLVAHGAEEWGNSNSVFDWGAGAYEQIIRIHPEWAEKAFALINIDGTFPIESERNFAICTSPELYNYVQRIAPDILSKFPSYKFEIKHPTLLLAEDFIYQKAGIPTIETSADLDNSLYFKRYYHSSLDNKIVGFDRETHKLIQVLYGSILIQLDNIPVRPMDFETRFLELKKDLNHDLVDKKFLTLIDELCYYSKNLSDKIGMLNTKYYSLHYTPEKINWRLYNIYKKIQDNFLAFVYNAEIVFPHFLPQQNLDLLGKAIQALETSSESINDVLYNYILNIDLNFNVFDFDKRTYDFIAHMHNFASTGTFGEKMFMNPNEDLYKVSHLLKEKADEESPNLDKEIAMLKSAYNNQSLYFNEAIVNEWGTCTELLKMIKDLLLLI